MKMIPLFRCTDIRRSIAFYTDILGFKLQSGNSPDDVVVTLTNEDAALMLTSLEGDQKPGIAANVLVKNIDELSRLYIARGLDTSHKKESPVHQGPLNQTWGTREFYVTDPDGNTLRFTQPL
jgi:catechol 2,3-dioxygenase-like lactoylglutathione lyase family enzyme